MRPLARAYVRDVLNRLNSEDFYNPGCASRRPTTPPEVLAASLRPYGVIVEQVMLGDFSFKPEYQKLINSRKEAEKTAEKLEAEILATRRRTRRTCSRRWPS